MTEKVIRSLYSSELGNAYKPTRSPEADQYWSGCREGRLIMPHCQSCGELHFYPRPFCPHCGGNDLAWRQLSGAGEVYTFAVVKQPLEKVFTGLIPYIIAIVELEEGIRILSHVIEVHPEEIKCGLKVQVDFREVSPTLTIPIFRPQTGSDADAIRVN